MKDRMVMFRFWYEDDQYNDHQIQAGQHIIQLISDIKQV